jgi:hypothetical protein
MTLRIPDPSEEFLLDTITAVNYTLKLFKNDVESGLTEAQKSALTVASFTEATFTGYASVALTGGSWTTTQGDPSTATYAVQTFASTANQASTTQYGYYVIRTTGGALVWYEYLPSAQAIAFNGDTIRVTPRLTLKDNGRRRVIDKRDRAETVLAAVHEGHGQRGRGMQRTRDGRRLVMQHPPESHPQRGRAGGRG